MAVFTAIATAIVTGITGAAVVAGTWAAFAVSVIATGLAIVTARIIAPGARGGGGVQDQGVRVQLPPATENKIPVVYGRAFQQGIITDARNSSVGGSTYDTMTYVITLSEKTDSGSYSVGNIYWNDQILNFDTDNTTVISTTDPDGSTDTKLNGLVKVWLWAGGSQSAYQIKGPSPAVNAYDIIPETTSSYQLTNLVFAVVQLTYSPDNGVTALPTMTFELINTLTNPGDVIQDYLLNDRYGCGFVSSDIDTDSLTGSTSTSLKSISNQIPPNQFNNDGSTSTQARYVINGVLNTGDTVKNNLERLNLASSSWLTFDHKLGQWSVVVNRAATASELASARTFNDDNIIGEITLTSTNLEDLFNSVESQYPNRNARDQSDYYRAEISSTLRNDLEPDNKLQMRLDMVNNRIHAGRVSQIELKQSRYDLLITFTADYSALETEVGDVIKVTNPIYDFTDKLFRVTRVRETEGEEGTLACEITALQYDASVYTDETLVDGENQPSSDIPISGGSTSLPPPSKVIVSDSQPTANTPHFKLTTTISTSSGPVSLVEWYYSDNTSTGFVWLDNVFPADGGLFGSGSVVEDTITNLVEEGTWYFKARTGVSGQFSSLSTASDAFVWNPQPAGADNGTINTSTFSSNIFMTSTATGVFNLTMSTGTSVYAPIRVDTDLTYNASTNKIKTGPWEVSTNTNAVYGQFLATGTQSIATSTVVAAVTFDESVYQDGITLTTSSHINLPDTGKYSVTFSTQFSNSGGQAARALQWLRKNGVDELDTNTAITVPARHGSTDGTAVLTVNFVNEHQAGDYIELYWNAESADISVKTISSSTVAPIYPRAPAVVLSVFKITGGYG